MWKIELSAFFFILLNFPRKVAELFRVESTQNSKIGSKIWIFFRRQRAWIKMTLSRKKRDTIASSEYMQTSPEGPPGREGNGGRSRSTAANVLGMEC